MALDRVDTVGTSTDKGLVNADFLSVSPPLVTIVVPARNEEKNIRECLDAILRQDFEDYELLVVDGASTDKTPEIIQSMASIDPRIRLMHNPDKVIPRSLNLALDAARGRWLIRVDAHAEIPSDYVSRVVAHLSEGKYRAVGGRKDGVGRTAAGQAIAAAMGSPFGVGNSTYHFGDRMQTVEHVPFGAYSVELARELGGWDERLSVNQDFEFDYRVRSAGYDILFDPALVIDWECRQSIRDLFSQYKRYGRGKVAVAVLHPASLRARHLMAPALVAAWATAAAMARSRPVISAGLTGPYVLAVALASAKTSRGLPDRAARRNVAPAFVAMHAGWGIGFWSGVARTAARRVTPSNSANALAPMSRDVPVTS